MIDIFLNFIRLSFRDVPTSFLVGMLALFGFGTVLFMAFLGGKRGARWSARLMLFEYMVMLVALAVFTRKVESTSQFNFTPFWSYCTIMDGNLYLLIQNFANVGALAPIGLLLGCTFDRMRWWKVLLIGGGFSILIEVLQFVFKRGFAEFDDVFHNALGCMIGFGLYLGITSLIKRASTRRVES